MTAQTQNSLGFQNINGVSKDFALDRAPERSGALFPWLLQQSTIHGVSEALASEVLRSLQAEDVVAELERLMERPDELAQVAKRSYLHGNGFYKLVVGTGAHAKVRLHYWNQQEEAEENIHNHRWHLASRVLLGELSSELYEQCAHNDEDAQLLQARLYQKQLGQLDADGVSLGLQAVKVSAQVTRCAGEAYAMNTATLHRIVRTKRSPKTLTLMVQSAPVYQDNYMLSFPHVTEPKMSPEPLSVEELKAVLCELIEQLTAHKTLVA